MTTYLYLSDIHLEFNKNLLDFNLVMPKKVADIVILAGDIAGGTHALPFIQHLLKLGYKVIYILGNHEFYCYDVSELIQQWTHISNQLDNFYFLNDNSVIINDIEFIGATLWTSLNTRKKEEYIDNIFINTILELNDFKYIKNWSPELMKDTFYRSFEKIQSLVSNSQCDKKVVVTHHLPSYQSITEHYVNDLFNPFYATELGNYIAYSDINCWIHGHVHSSFDYFLGDTNILCNPYGYKDKNMINFLFQWQKLVKTL
jgi:predicted phosphohydrolase